MKKKELKNKILSILMSGAICLSSIAPLPVMAEEETYPPDSVTTDVEDFTDVQTESDDFATEEASIENAHAETEPEEESIESEPGENIPDKNSESDAENKPETDTKDEEEDTSEKEDAEYKDDEVKQSEPEDNEEENKVAEEETDQAEETEDESEKTESVSKSLICNQPGTSSPSGIMLMKADGVFTDDVYGWATILQGERLDILSKDLSKYLDKDIIPIYGADINVTNSAGEKMTDLGIVTVEMPVAELSDAYLYHLKDGGQWEELSYTSNGGYAVFETGSFSPFLFVKEAEEEEIETEETEESEEETEPEEIFSFTDATITSSMSSIGVDVENSSLSGDAVINVSAMNDGDTDPYTTSVTETFYLPEGVIVPNDVSTDGASVYGNGNVLFSLADTDFAKIVSAGSSGNSVYVTVESSEFGLPEDAVLVMHGNGFGIDSDEETLYKPISSPEEADDDVTVNDDLLTEEESKNVEEDTLALKVIKTSSSVKEGAAVGVDAEIDLTSEEGETISLVTGTNISVDNAEDDFETEEVIVLYAPIYSNKVYGEDPFDEEYSSGTLYVKSFINEQDITYGSGLKPMYSSTGFVHLGTNHTRSEDCYKYVPNGAIYNNKFYDLKTYTWSNMPSYSVRNFSVGNDWGDYAPENDPENFTRIGTHEDYLKPDCRIWMEMHIIDPDTGKDVEWKGTCIYYDLDDGEGYTVQNVSNMSDIVYTTNDATDYLKTETIDGNTWVLGKTINDTSANTGAMIFVQMKTDTDNKILLGYQCPNGLDSGSLQRTRSVNFYLTSDSDIPNGMNVDQNKKIFAPSYDYYALYGTFRVPEIQDYPGYTVQGWGSSDNFSAPDTGEKYIVGSTFTLTDDMNYYLRYKKIVGNVDVKKTVTTNGGTDKTAEGWVFTLSGKSVSNENINMSATTGSDGIAHFNNVPIGSYTVTEDVDQTIWSVTPGNSQPVTVKANETMELSFHNEFKIDNRIIVINKVEDPTKMHESPDGFIYKLEGTTDAGEHVEKTGTTKNGTVIFDNLKNGTFTVTEIGTPESPNEIKDYWTVKPVSHQVTVKNNGEETVEFLNILKIGTVTVTKNVKDPSKTVTDFSGFTFTLTGTADIGDKISKTATTDSSGVAVFTTIPVGTYTVEETGTPGGDNGIASWWEAENDSASVKVEDGKDTKVTVENIYKTGNLRIKKTVNDNGTGIKGLEGFVFTVRGTSESGKTVRLEGKTDFSGELEFRNIPVGTYTVKETGTEESPDEVPPYWIVSPKEEQVTIEYGKTAEAAFTNTFKVADVIVNNVVEDPSGTHTDPKDFNYKLVGITGTGENIEEYGKTDPDGRYVFEDVPYGDYVVIEIGTPESPKEIKDYWTVVPVSQDADVRGEDVTVDFLNILKVGTVKVTKKVTDPSGTIKDLSGFVFTLTGTADIGDKITKTAETDKNGIATFANIPVGTYSVNETGTPESKDAVPSWWIAGEGTDNVKVEADKEVSLTVENIYKTGNLHIKKIVRNSKDGLEGFVFTLTGKSESGTDVNLKGTSDANGDLTIENIPVGTYVLKEIGTKDSPEAVPSEWTVTPNEQNVTILYNKTTEAEITNAFKTADIIVNNKVEDPTETHTDPNEFKYTLVGTSIDNEPIEIEGVTTDDGTLVFKDIPAGSYVVTEVGTPESPDEVKDYWTVIPESHPIEFEHEDMIVEFLNILKVGTVTVTKTVSDPTGTMTSLGGFVFTLSGKADIGDDIVKTAVTDETGKAVFENIPVGTYTVAETGASGSEEGVPSWWAAGESFNDVKVEADKDTALAFENIYKTGNLHIKKIVRNSSAGPDGFVFTLTGTSDSGNPVELSGASDENGDLTFNDIPVGTYVLKEVGVKDSPDSIPTEWTVTPAEQEVTIVYGETTEAEIVNTFKTSDIIVKNEVEDPSGIHTDPNDFRYVLVGTSIDGEPIEIEGVTTEDGTLIFKDVPTGSYTITEVGTPESPDEVKDYWTVKPISHDISVEGEDVTVDFLNILKVGNIPIIKTVVDPSGTATGLEGFVFTLTGKADIGDEIERTVMTNEEGKAVFADIPVGTYSVHETGTPEDKASVPAWWVAGNGYNDVKVEAGKDTELAFENIYKTGNLHVKKTVNNSSEGPEGFVFALKGISDSGKDIYITGATDEKGELTFINIPVGTYALREIGTKDSPDSLPPYWVVSPIEQEVKIVYHETAEAEVVNTKVVLIVEKTEKGTEKRVAGAELALIDSDGKEAYSWTTTNEDHVIEGIFPGKYTLVEKKAPAGYDKAADMAVEILDTADIQRVRMEDPLKPTATNTGSNPVSGGTPATGAKAATPAPKTGDTFGIPAFAGMGVAILALFFMGIMLIRKRRKEF